MPRAAVLYLSAVVLFLIFTIAPLTALDIADPDAEEWIGFLGSDIQRVEEAFGSGYSDIDPLSISSRAERVIWYENGLTFWFDRGRAVQLRVDSDNSFETAGFRFGMSLPDVRELCGTPWIESADSLYYNLPWQEGPPRLRFLFNENGLDEIYLYYVR